MRINGLKAEWLIILILLVVVAFQRACHKEKVCKVCKSCVVVHDTVLVYPKDTAAVKVTVDAYKPKHRKVIFAKPVATAAFNSSVDSLPCDSFIINNYFATFIYSDTLYNNDSTIVLTINDSITENAIQRRAVFIKDRGPLAIVTPTLLQPVAKKRVVINLGLMMGTNLQRFSIEPTFAIQTRRDDIILGGVDVLDKPVMYKVGYLMRVSFRKR
jgi:hypothetical protein